ncbi:hypothetical protein KCU64_g24, partial [Aureobasidium melanogenum]
MVLPPRDTTRALKAECFLMKTPSDRYGKASMLWLFITTRHRSKLDNTTVGMISTTRENQMVRNPRCYYTPGL